MSLTELEKQIYNTHLIASRVVKNKPFKLRQDFTKINDKTYILLKKLSLLFEHNRAVNITDFFKKNNKSSRFIYGSWRHHILE